MDNRFGQLVRNHRRIQDIQAAHLASSLGISAQYLSDIERGSRLPPNDCDLLTRWATLLDVPSASLYQTALCDREPDLCQRLGIDEPIPFVATGEQAEEIGRLMGHLEYIYAHGDDPAFRASAAARNALSGVWLRQERR